MRIFSYLYRILQKTSTLLEPMQRFPLLPGIAGSIFLFFTLYIMYSILCAVHYNKKRGIYEQFIYEYSSSNWFSRRFLLSGSFVTFSFATFKKTKTRR